MNRQILLVEPNYSNKYPPMGLMKLSTYYKNLGDHVSFFKGNLRDLVLSDTYEMLKTQLYANDNSVFWEQYKPQICKYLRKGSIEILDDVPGHDTNPIIKDLFRYYRQFFYRKDYFKPQFRKYDRVGVTTLFTFYWDITINTINFVKQLCKTPEGVMVGGVMATILADRVEAATGIKPHRGTLDIPGQLDPDNNMIIDTLPLDYSILEEIDYQYPASNAYYAYMTRGCTNACPFCAVPKLEPVYKEYLPVSEQVHIAEARYGAKRNLLLLDNNVLASCRFNDIIEDIKRAGFSANSTYVAPNHFEIAIQNLRTGQNDRGYIKSCVKQYKKLIEKNGAAKMQEVYDLLKEKHLLEEHTATKAAIFETYETLKPYFEEFYANRPKRRYVDFNQGIDSRLITDENMAKLAEIPIRPVRIAFDHWSLRKEYEKAVRTAVRHGHTNLSNYILYNFDDKPVELYWRLKLNVELCEELNASIYSFPMKYHPIEDPDYFSNRDYVGKYWNRKFIRTIQAILNSTKGKVGKGHDFFCKAFGSNEEEFYKLLYMPEAMIIYRFYFEGIGMTEKWWKDFNSLTEKEMRVIRPIIERNDFSNIERQTDNANVLRVLQYYCITREDAEQVRDEHK
ncbi:hypothetical protein H8S45_13320 [Agathobaculum sp. NSJ-28]|uniref:Radical SAM protein n=1 Tax=Agathobaculum faecis TaxID=2763013 RepID=A0A923RZM9_9FIRM|nr:hypothetical protein [Agathobaculum faecis]MBC5726435.1 hypothetical protein [Agathobaculum faecis]